MEISGLAQKTSAHLVGVISITSILWWCWNQEAYFGGKWPEKNIFHYFKSQNSTSHWGVGLHLCTVCGHLKPLCCVLLQPLLQLDLAVTTPAHIKEFQLIQILHGSQASTAWRSVPNRKTTPPGMMTATDWTGTMALLSSLEDHFGSWVLLTMVTLWFIQLLKTKLKKIPFKHPHQLLVFRTITTG